MLGPQSCITWALPSTGPGNQMQVFWKISKCSYPLSYLSRPWNWYFDSSSAGSLVTASWGLLIQCKWEGVCRVGPPLSQRLTGSCVSKQWVSETAHGFTLIDSLIWSQDRTSNTCGKSSVPHGHTQVYVGTPQSSVWHFHRQVFGILNCVSTASLKNETG